MIIINGRFLTRRLTGVERHATEVIKALDRAVGNGRSAQRRSIALLVPSGSRHPLPLQHIAIRTVGRLRGHAWEQVELPIYAAGALLLNLCNTAPVLKRRQIVTIHDASVYARPDAYSRAFRTWYRMLTPALGRVARRVVTDSSFSLQELSRFGAVPAAKLTIIPLGADHVLDTPPDFGILQRHALGQRPFIFALSSHSPHKNLSTLARALEAQGELPYDVVIAGSGNGRVFEIDRVTWPDAVRDVGYVSDGELRALYQHAACFVFPSLYEGFGLPPLEAMACGCPVIVAKAASLPEVCGDAALYFEPHRPDELGRRLAEVMAGDALRRDLRMRGLRRARLFGWNATAHALLALVDEVEGR